MAGSGSTVCRRSVWAKEKAVSWPTTRCLAERGAQAVGGVEYYDTAGRRTPPSPPAHPKPQTAPHCTLHTHNALRRPERSGCRQGRVLLTRVLCVCGGVYPLPVLPPPQCTRANTRPPLRPTFRCQKPHGSLKRTLQTHLMRGGCRPAAGSQMARAGPAPGRLE